MDKVVSNKSLLPVLRFPTPTPSPDSEPSVDSEADEVEGERLRFLHQGEDEELASLSKRLMTSVKMS